MKFPSCTTRGRFFPATCRRAPARPEDSPSAPGVVAAGRTALLLAPLLLSLLAPPAWGEGGATPAEWSGGGGGVAASSSYRDRVISEDTVWRGEVTVEGALSIAPQATLRIEPGTTVRFRRGAGSPGVLMVQGRIVAAGSADAPIVFAGAASRPQAGEWQGVILLGTEKKNLLEHLRVEGAATALEILYSTATLKNVRLTQSTTGAVVQDSFVTMEGCSVSECRTALLLRESEVEIYRGGFSGNTQGIVAVGGSLYLSDGELSRNRGTALAGEGVRLKVSGGTVGDNGSGLLLSGCEGTISGVRFSGNVEVALSLGRSRVRVTGNEIVKNVGTGVRVEDGAAVAWGNAILENGGYDLYNAGREEFRAPGNWWGAAGPKLFDNEGRGALLLVPLLSAPPQK